MMLDEANTTGWRFQEFQFDSDLDPRGFARSETNNA